MHSQQQTAGAGAVAIQAIGDNISIAVGAARLTLAPRHRLKLAQPKRELNLLLTELRVIDLVGRDAELAALRGWLDNGRRIGVRCLTGRAGAGKTRLAIELCEQAEAAGWTAGFATQAELQRFHDAASLDSWHWQKPTLIVVDYAAASQRVLRAWLELLARRPPDQGDGPLRFLLLERSADPRFGWWAELTDPGGASGRGPDELADPPEPVVLPVLALVGARQTPRAAHIDSGTVRPKIRRPSGLAGEAEEGDRDVRLKLAREWDIGSQIGTGGFGTVFEATCADESVGPCVAKLVPKDPGAERELLFVQLDNARNIIPVIDSGETEDSWVLVMPRADKSLLDQMKEVGKPFEVHAAIVILSDIATALADLSGKVVHRDLKPANVLLLNGKWCLADFGISRYAEATTAPDTRKYAMSLPYAAPERWRSETATAATDVYALGIIGFELLTGARPFPGPSESDYRQQHLHESPGNVGNVPPGLAALVGECLYKGTGSRPSPKEILERLTAIAERAPAAGGRARLQQVNVGVVARQGEEARLQSAGRSEMERREELFRDAAAAFRQIGDALLSAIKEDASSAVLDIGQNGSWSVTINQAELLFSTPSLALLNPTSRDKLDVIGFGSITVQAPENQFGYRGRSHSLWYCNAREPARYSWFEIGFNYSPLLMRTTAIRPFASQPGQEIAIQALSPGLGTYQVGFPFTQVVSGELDEFVGRWLGWLADAAQGRLHPGN